MNGTSDNFYFIYYTYNVDGVDCGDVYLIGDISNILSTIRIKLEKNSWLNIKERSNMVRNYDDTIVRANNMSAEQIIDNFNLTEEGIRHYFSSLCFGNNATEEHPYKLDIDVDGTFGLSESEKIKYLSVYEQEGEGIIWFIVGGIYDEKPEHIEIDDLSIEEKLYIIQKLEGVSAIYND